MTNYGNGYKFAAICARRHKEPEIVYLQRMTKKGWGKPSATELMYHETAEQALNRIRTLNPNYEWRIAE